VWLYRPESHKMSYRGRSRLVPLVPRAQTVLLPYLDGRSPDAYLFDPREVRAEQGEQRRALRKTPKPRVQVARRVAAPRRSPRPLYTPDTYGRAIRRACAAAGVSPWHPHQLGHRFATEVRRQFGLESAQVLLGHTNARVTAVYAERDWRTATEVAAQIG
jgi:integrase